MEKVRFIGSKRRTNTPISYRQRVVQYRHRPLKQHAIYKTQKQVSKVETVINQLIPQKFVENIKLDENLDNAKVALTKASGKIKFFLADVGNKAKESSRHAWQLLQTKYRLLKDDLQKRKEERLEKQKVLQATKAEEERKRTEAAAKEMAQPVKMTRKERLIAEADRDISTAKTDALTRLLFPAYAIDRLAKNQDDFMMFIGVAIRNTIHWIAFAYFLSAIFASYINLSPFGFTRMNFSDTFIMSLKLSLLFILFEVIYLVISGLIANIKVSYNYRHQLASLTSIASVLPTVLYILAIIMLSKSMLLGILLGILGMVASVYLRIQAYIKSAPFATSAQMIVLMIVVAGFICTAYFYIPLTMQNIVEMLKTLLNI
jgi:membrane protein